VLDRNDVKLLLKFIIYPEWFQLLSLFTTSLSIWLFSTTNGNRWSCAGASAFK